MRTVHALMLTVALVAGAGAASAQEVQYPECKCQNYGRLIPAGSVTCIRTDKGPQMARCVKRGNVTDWDFLGEECSFTSMNEAPATPVAVGARAPAARLR